MLVVVIIFAGLYVIGHHFSKEMIEKNWTLALLILLGLNVVLSVTISFIFLIRDALHLYM